MVAGAAAGAVLLLSNRSGASEQENPAPRWGRSALGTPMSSPAGVDAACIHEPTYLPNGRYAVASRHDSYDGRNLPIVFDTVTGERHELPASESWFAYTMSESRGVLLTALYRQSPDGPWTADWVEIPLSALFAN
jgi:hypothetical protein